MRAALLIYGALNAILYAGLTPLWEGFDEPFHYGYVQHLRLARSLPVQKGTCLSEEVWQSFPLAPASFIVKRNLPMVTTFDDYFRLSQAERLARRRALEQLNPELAAADSNAPNYEAQQVPLAYALLTPFDAVWASVPLPRRVWRLRLVCAVSSTLATGLLLFRLAGLLGFDEHSSRAAVFLAFSSQMFYATTAHVTNDYLALPLFLLVLVSAIDLYLEPRRAAVLMLSIALAAGLLTKAYFLALVPFAAGVVLARCDWRDGTLFAAAGLLPAAPWYVRNLVLYRDLAGLQENVGGIPMASVVTDALHLPWARALVTTLKTSFWEGNSSATTFGAATLWLMILLLALAVGRVLIRRPRGAPLVLIAGLASFAAGLAYNTVIQWRATNGAGMTPAPWYVQLLFPPAFCLVVAGAGRLLRTVMCGLWAYVIIATYIAKLIPLYGGYSGRPARLMELVRWYTGSFPQIREILATTAMIPPPALFALTTLVAGISVLLAWRITQPFFRSHK